MADRQKITRILITATAISAVGGISFCFLSGTSWLFAVIGVFVFIFTWRLVPESRGLNLEKIEEHFTQGKHPRQLGTASPNKKPGGNA